MSNRKGETLSNSDRAQWLDRDAGLNSLWRASGQDKYASIKANRAMIDKVIHRARRTKQLLVMGAHS